MFKNSSVSYRPKSTMHTHAVSAGVQEPVQALKACTSLKKRLGAFLYNGYLKRMYVYKFEEEKFDVSVKKKKKKIDGEGTLGYKRPYPIYSLPACFILKQIPCYYRTFKIFKHFFNNHT